VLRNAGADAPTLGSFSGSSAAALRVFSVRAE
jgi:hypothetical protein